MARILAQAGLRAVAPDGGDGIALAARRRLAAEPWHLWPCNLRAWEFWCGLQTQWRVGMAGATGLDYASVLALLDRSGLRPRRRAECFEHVRAMEREVLRVWADRAEAERAAARR